MNTKTKNLFAPFSSPDQPWKNRIVMAPMTRSRAIGHKPGELAAAYYAQRAASALIITEGTAPSPEGIGYARTPGIYNEGQQQGWAKVAGAVHAAGGKIFLQLMHVGRIAHPDNMPEDTTIMAPSPVKAAGSIWTDTKGMQEMGDPAEMSAGDIRRTIQAFAAAAKRAIAAGFDGVELHGANGYLLEQFLNPHANQRGDEYGGSIENRVRFILEVTDAVAEAIGKDKLGYRISPYSTYNDMPLYDEIPETYKYLVAELGKRELLYLHVVDIARRDQDASLAIADLRSRFDGLLILNGGFDRETAENALNRDSADLISFGAGFLANPDLPYRLEHRLELNAPDPATFFSADAKGYIDYPFHEQNEKALITDPAAGSNLPH